MLLNTMYVYGIIYGIYILIAPVICKYNCKKIIIIFWITWSIVPAFFAYLLEPSYTLDLYRYYEWIYEAGISYTSIYDAAVSEPLFVRECVYYVCSCLESPHFFSAVPAYLQYLLPLIIIFCEGEKYNVSIKGMLFLGFVFIAVSDFFTIISVVRCPLSVQFFFFVLYLEIRNKLDRKFCFIIYFMLPFFHTVGFALLFFRLFIFNINITKSKFFFFFLVMGLLAEMIFDSLLEMINGDLLISLALQSDSYFFNTESISEMSGDMPKFIFYGIILGVFCCTSIFLGKKYNIKYIFDEDLNKYIDFLQRISIFASLVIIINPEVSNRFTYPLVMAELIYLIPFLGCSDYRMVRRFVYPFLVLFSLFGVYYQTRYYPFINFYL